MIFNINYNYLKLILKHILVFLVVFSSCKTKKISSEFLNKGDVFTKYTEYSPGANINNNYEENREYHEEIQNEKGEKVLLVLVNGANINPFSDEINQNKSNKIKKT